MNTTTIVKVVKLGRILRMLNSQTEQGDQVASRTDAATKQANQDATGQPTMEDIDAPTRFETTAAAGQPAMEDTDAPTGFETTAASEQPPPRTLAPCRRAYKEVQRPRRVRNAKLAEVV